MTIFASTAPQYWKANLPAIPLIFEEKRPAISDWSRFSDSMPLPEEQDAWLNHFANNNIGLVLGPQSNLVMIDIDTDDDRLIGIIRGLLPISPWCRVGRKGMILAFRYNGLPTFRIKDTAGRTIVEHLAARTQIVLPPSIHPDTRRAYTSNAELYEVLDGMMSLPDDIETKLRTALSEAGVDLSHSGWSRVTDYVSIGSRDVTMTGVAGHYARGVVRGELPLTDAIDRMKGWYSSCVEHVAGDDVSIDKGIQNLLKFLRRDVLDKGVILPVDWDKGLTDEEKENLGLNFDKDQEQWSFDEVKEFLKQSFENNPNETKQRFDCIDQALKKIAFLDTIDRELLLQYIRDSGGMKLTLSTLRKRMDELSQGEIEGKDHTEIAQAVIADLEKTSQIAYHNNDFLKWEGSHWGELKTREIRKTIAENYGNFAASKKRSDHRGILDVIADLIPQRIRELETDGVNFANGMVISTGELVPHRPEFGMLYTLPYRYMKEESQRALRFFDFLHACWGKDSDFEDKKKALQEAICATIFGIAPQYQRAFLLYGAPKTGKSQMLRIVERLMHDNSRSYCPPSEWGERFGPAQMAGKLINICGELSENKLIDGRMFKSIVSGEEMGVERKNQQGFSMRPICAQWFASNHLPKTADTSNGFNRRWLVLTFQHPVKDDDRVLNLGDQIVAEEREAIAAWAIEALPRLRKKSEYTLPRSHVQMMDEVANANNSVRYFLRESGMVKFGSGSVVDAKLHLAYWNFCVGPAGAKPFGTKAFRAKMQELSAEFNFSLKMEMKEMGTVDAVYQGIELRKPG